MYILFEEYQYKSHLVEKILKDIYVLQNVDKKVSVHYVGYFYNPKLNGGKGDTARLRVYLA